MVVFVIEMMIGMFLVCVCLILCRIRFELMIVLLGLLMCRMIVLVCGFFVVLCRLCVMIGFEKLVVLKIGRGVLMVGVMMVFLLKMIVMWLWFM